MVAQGWFGRRVAPVVVLWLFACGAVSAGPPVPLIFDTDLGNDCDDALALAMVHAFESRGECELLAVTLTKGHPDAAACADAINTFYGRGDVPIGVCRDGKTPAEGAYNRLAHLTDDGRPRYPHDLASGADAPPAVRVLREALAGAEDQSVVICQVGFSTNLAALLDSPPDALSQLTGQQLVAQKVRLLSAMAGGFKPRRNREGELVDRLEYNIVNDVPSARAIAERWPTPIVWSVWEVGNALKYPHESIEQDYGYAPHHPVVEAYCFFRPPPHDRPTWDLTSVLHAVRPDRGYFRLSEPGTVAIDERGVTTFTAGGARDRYLIVDKAAAPKALEAMVQLASQPPR